MFNVWRASTIVFVLQLILGGSMFAEVHDFSESVVFVWVATFFVTTGLLGNGIGDDLYMVSWPACAAAFAVFLATLGYGFGFALVFVFTLLLTYLVAVVGQRGRREPGWLILIAALPAGIGFLAGGAILLYLLFYETANEPIA